MTIFNQGARKDGKVKVLAGGDLRKRAAAARKAHADSGYVGGSTSGHVQGVGNVSKHGFTRNRGRFWDNSSLGSLLATRLGDRQRSHGG